ncbi:MAG: 50S ribosomal protein L24 [Candidatus Daviesbacteria bacterium]
MKIQKNDNVKILVGKDAGRTGKVLRVLPKESKVIVEGINMYKRHIRKTGQNQGGIIEIAKPLDISNVALICPNCKKETRIGYKTENDKKIRICKKCQKEITKGEKK